MVLYVTLLLLAILLIFMGLQFITLGLIAELVVAGRRPEEEFRIARRV